MTYYKYKKIKKKKGKCEQKKERKKEMKEMKEMKEQHVHLFYRRRASTSEERDGPGAIGEGEVERKKCAKGCRRLGIAAGRGGSWRTPWILRRRWR